MKAALVAVQLAIDADVLASADAYRRHLEQSVARALDAAGAADHRLVVLPEVSGHLALYALSPSRAHRSKTLGGALAQAAVRRPLDVLRGVVSSRVLAPKSAVLAALAPDGEAWWKGVFGPLAKQHAATIVAGSHLHLAPDGAVTNASLTFAPDGRAIASTDKVNLVPNMEDAGKGGLGLARGDADAIPIVGTPLGTLATLICYDGFRVPHTDLERFIAVAPRLAARGGVTIVANPAANPWPWREPWPLRPTLVRAAQWQAEGLPATMAETPFARYGITAHLVGKVLDLHFDGASEILERDAAGQVHVRARAEHHDRGGHVLHTIDV